MNPCAYGPRGPDGKCPRKVSGKLSKNDQALLRKATAAGEKVVKAGVTGAAAAIKAGLAEAGISGAAAAGTVALVAGAALLGWFIGNGINEFYEGNSVEAVKARASTRYGQARRALSAQLGRDINAPNNGLTAAELAPLTKAWKDSIATIEASGRDTAYFERVRANLGNPNNTVY